MEQLTKKTHLSSGTELRLGRKGAKGSLCTKSKEAVQNAKVQNILHSVLILLPCELPDIWHEISLENCFMLLSQGTFLPEQKQLILVYYNFIIVQY